MLAVLAVVATISVSSPVLPALADKDISDYKDIEDLAKDVDDGELDDDSVNWSDFKNSVAFKSADDEIQDCIKESEELGNNLGDYEILECVDEYN